ncbi:MAG: hypothetical protein CO103_07600 [Chloroflexi bacterium CG_4_9_14_3_um_filter_45_9]|nr:MAG: hypothetical protein AUK00_04690 [Dehalococcoidia bacterium CG2_30_46_9]PIU23950.1 MAG: hypothetical protein COT13_00310 [Chloroflexi bacterium CG08_land_8_20_14_0_20_45_12]PIX27285.1 MAG: hypothetical protein COZ67_03100 [Chloroflexi bacterium CG_4_8_14_3_um_filter_45_15]PJB48255.1 MAG: hypothetical protein CO103_07600 [Chloroflexi bacterium CG_4_9_14_3_um_filter_45_9]
MSKKSRRSKSKYRARTTKADQRRHLEQPKAVTEKQNFPGELIRPVTVRPQMPASISRKSQHPVADYSYLGRDIRDIGIIAGSLIVILIILSFIL